MLLTCFRADGTTLYTCRCTGTTSSHRATPGSPSDAHGMTNMPDLPPAQGLYDPAYEHDACGVAFVVDMHGRRSHRMVQLGLASLCHLDHRGATNAEANVGDGAGILLQVPDGFLRAVVDFALPPRGRYAVGAAFLPGDAAEADAAAAAVEAVRADGGRGSRPRGGWLASAGPGFPSTRR